jgi:ATP synthase assembly factor FMC1
MYTPAPPQILSLYRRLLRELPPLPKPSSTTPLRASIRAHFVSPSSQNVKHHQQTDQAIQYLRAQRVYMTLLERYNPGMTMEDEERTRLTARRVGMEMPVEFKDLARELEKNKK